MQHEKSGYLPPLIHVPLHRVFILPESIFFLPKFYVCYCQVPRNEVVWLIAATCTYQCTHVAQPRWGMTNTNLNSPNNSFSLSLPYIKETSPWRERFGEGDLIIPCEERIKMGLVPISDDRGGSSGTSAKPGGMVLEEKRPRDISLGFFP